MRDHRRAQNMNSYSHGGRTGKYEKEMDHAFTLIFHNIKRLQDGVLSNSYPNLTRPYNHKELEKKPEVTQEPRIRKRSRSETCLGIIGVQNGDVSLSLTVPQVQKSGSFNAVSEVGKSPTQRRKVRFADEGKTQTSCKRSPLLSEHSDFQRHKTCYSSTSDKLQKGHEHRTMKSSSPRSNEGQICQPEIATDDQTEPDFFHGTEV